MTETPERRRAARINVPAHLTGPGTQLRLVRIVDLSSEGARIEVTDPLPEGLVCYLEVPPAPSPLRLTCSVVWSRLHKSEQTVEGDKHRYYRSGLTFIGMTTEQQTALAAALERIRAEISRTTDTTPESETSGS